MREHDDLIWHQQVSFSATIIVVCLSSSISCLLHRGGVRRGHRGAALREEADRVAGAGVAHHLHPGLHDLRQRPHSRYVQPVPSS